MMGVMARRHPMSYDGNKIAYVGTSMPNRPVFLVVFKRRDGRPAMEHGKGLMFIRFEGRQRTLKAAELQSP